MEAIFYFIPKTYFFQGVLDQRGSEEFVSHSVFHQGNVEILKNGNGKGVGLLKDHSDSFSEFVQRGKGRSNVSVSKKNFAAHFKGGSVVGKPIETTQEARLPHTGRSHQCENLVLSELKVNSLEERFLIDFQGKIFHF